MTHLKTIILVSFLIFFFISCSNKLAYKSKTTETYFENNESNQYRNSKIEIIIHQLVQSKYLNFDEEDYVPTDILDSKEKAAIFAKQIALFMFPEYKGVLNRNCEVIEDKTGKLWLVRLKLTEVGLDNELTLLIIKNNCKVVFQSNDL